MDGFNFDHMMLDFETMSLEQDAAIVSIGAVLFDPVHGVVSDQTFYIECDWQNQNRDISQSTLAFWDKQNDHARQALNGSTDLKTALLNFKAFTPSNCSIWGNGSSFDVSLLQNASRHLEIDVWRPYYKIMDMRTIAWLHDELICQDWPEFEGVKHNALDDAINQAKLVCHFFQKLRRVNL